MSYRLIDANAITVLLPEVNDMPCIYADLPRGLDGGHYDMREPGELQHENAKLRELVWDYYLYEHGDCHTCRYHDECRDDESCTCIAPMRLVERVRELGI